MTHDPLMELTARLRAAVDDVGDLDAMPARRDEAVARLADALRKRRRARRQRRMMGAFAAVAAAIAVGLGSRQMLHAIHRQDDAGRVRDSIAVVHGAQTEELGPGARVAEGTELRTAASEAHLDFATGTQLTLAPSSRVRLVEQTKKKVLALDAGALTAHVAKLSHDERFVVTTGDAEVEVRGTVFRVSVVDPDPSCGGGARTRVDVTEGIVWVHPKNAPDAEVRAGGRWPACAPRPAPASASAPPAPSAVAVAALPNAGPPRPHAPPSAAPRPSPPSTTATPTSSRLAEQNALYDDAMRAKREGRNDEAVRSLDRLLASYPDGPLAESATAERMRLVAAVDRSRGAALARAYLAHYPNGFARAEAEALERP